MVLLGLPRAANDVENFARVEIHHLNGEQVLYNALPLQPVIGESGSSGQSQKKMKQALLSLFFVRKRPHTRRTVYQTPARGHRVYWRNKRAPLVFGLDNSIDACLQFGNMILGRLEVSPIQQINGNVVIA